MALINMPMLDEHHSSIYLYHLSQNDDWARFADFPIPSSSLTCIHPHMTTQNSVLACYRGF